MPTKAKDPNELGALWLKQGAKGDYLTGVVNGQPVVAFKNEYWTEGGKQPYWRILKPKPKEAPWATSATPDEDVAF